MAGLTPFLFSSNMLQQTVLQGSSRFDNLTSLLTNGLINENKLDTSSWYEMWLNPESISIQDRYIQNRQHTAGSIVTFHYRQDVKVVEVAGAVGWVQIESASQNADNGAFNLLKGDTRNIRKSLRDTYVSYTTNGVVDQNKLKAQLNQWNPSNSQSIRLKSGRHANNTNNSPRIFLQRLKDLADQPAYYYDWEGKEHYNVKYIKMYTKQFPNGVIAEGYFTSFQVPETKDDVQTVRYSFEYIVENLRKITIAQRVPGMYSSTTNPVTGTVKVI
jgi:hypothetical protein